MDMWMDVDAALAEVPVNIMPLLDDTDFKSRETAVAFNAAGMDLVWNFVTTAGAYTQTAVTPTSGGSYDWAHQGDGMYSIEIPASGGASINNDTEGFGWFTGVATGVLPWRGPVIGFRAAGLNDLLIDSAYSTTRGLAGTALPAAAAEAAGGLYTRGTGAGQINQANNGQIDANAARTGGTTNTGRDIGASVLLSSGTGAGQISLSSGAVLLQATQTGVTIPTVTTVGSVTGAVGSVTGAVGSVTGNIGGNVVGSVGSVTTVSDKTGYRLSATGVDDVWDEVMEGSFTARQFARGLAAALLGELSGAGTTTIEIRDASDTKVRITATVDANGNRSVVVLDLT